MEFLFEKPSTLPEYHQGASPIRRAVKYGSLYAVAVLLALFYGFSIAMFPPIILMYFSAPLVGLGILVLWAFKDLADPPLKALTISFIGFALVVIIWPDYLSIQIPGLPWLSLRRVLSVAMTLAFVLCYSFSPKFREDLHFSLKSASLFFKLFLAFLLIQFVTLVFADNPLASLNRVSVQILIWTVPLLVAALLLKEPRVAKKWVSALLFATMIQVVIGLLEFRNGGLLWANHIPAFLLPDAEVVDRILEGRMRQGIYRVTSTWIVSLSYAEYLAISAPFVLHRAFTTTNVFKSAFWFSLDILVLLVITLTQSRLGVVGWLVTHMVYVLFWGIRRWQARKTDIIGPAIGIFYPVALVALALAAVSVPALHHRTFGGGATNASNEARKQQYQLFWPKLFSNPIGYGAGQSGTTLGYRQPDGLITVDSYPITLGIDYGFTGIITFFGMLFVSIFGALRIYLRSRSPISDLGLPVAAALVTFCVTRMVLSQQETVPLAFMLMGFAAALVAHSRSDDREPPGRRGAVPPRSA